MLWDLKHRVSDRKERLLAAAFCQHISHLVSEDRCQRLIFEGVRFGTLSAVPTPERSDFLLRLLARIEDLADGVPSAPAADRLAADALSRVKGDYYSCYDESWGPMDTDLFATCEAAAALFAASGRQVDAVEVATLAARAAYRANGGEEQKTGDPNEAAAQCDLIRDIIFHPDHSVAINRAWLTSDVLALARGIYTERAFDRMPILADALQDAGCENTDVLNHCRDTGTPHVRGCWVIDLLLDL
jgi:hypothetical protein